MELNKTYEVNIVSQTADDRCSFIVVEQFNHNSSQYFQNYYRRLMRFNQCSEWFRRLDYPNIDIGKIVLAQTDRKKNIWSRGIISQYSNNNLPKLYFIDAQRFSDLDTYFELRICPLKFSQLTLPTCSIKANFCLNDHNQLQSAIEMLIEKNQYGDINFNFTPQSVTNNVYFGELVINHKINNSVITFEKFVKMFWGNKIFNDLIQNRPNGCSVFNPLQFSYLKHIFLPKDPNSIIFSDKNVVSSFPEQKDLFDVDEFSSFLDYVEYYKYCLDESALSDKKIHANHVSIKEQKMYSLENSKTPSICSLEETRDTTSVDSSLIENIDKNQKISSNYDDGSKPNSVISTNTIADELNRLSIASDDSICTNDTMSEIKSNGSNDKNIDLDVSNDEFDVKALITNHVRCLRKLKDNTSCQPNHFTKTEEEKSEKKKIPSKTKVVYNDIELWWTDSDDTDSEK